MAPDVDDLTDPGGEAYDSDGCPWWGQELASVDRWRDGSLHCSKCGRLTEIRDGERVHVR